MMVAWYEPRPEDPRRVKGEQWSGFWFGGDHVQENVSKDELEDQLRKHPTLSCFECGEPLLQGWVDVKFLADGRAIATHAECIGKERKGV